MLFSQIIALHIVCFLVHSALSYMLAITIFDCINALVNVEDQ